MLDELIGLLCNCVLPAELNESRVRQVKSQTNGQDGDKKKLRSRSSRIVSTTPNAVPTPALTPCTSGSDRQRYCLPQTLVHDPPTT